MMTQSKFKKITRFFSSPYRDNVIRNAWKKYIKSLKDNNEYDPYNWMKERVEMMYPLHQYTLDIHRKIIDTYFNIVDDKITNGNSVRLPKDFARINTFTKDSDCYEIKKNVFFPVFNIDFKKTNELWKNDKKMREERKLIIRNDRMAIVKIQKGRGFPSGLFHIIGNRGKLINYNPVLKISSSVQKKCREGYKKNKRLFLHVIKDL